MTQAGGKNNEESFLPRVELKICGLTRVNEAEECVRLGADAIGCVFFPRSPRHVSDERAADICRAVSGAALPVGVFVDETFDFIMRKVQRCGLAGVQLHGCESPSLVQRLRREGLLVIKAVFAGGKPAMADADTYPAAAFLVECAQGPLPGGNAMAWDWAAARPFGRTRPMVLAGGLSPQNVVAAVAAARPAAVDVSSGVESSPGRKDLKKVAEFVKAVSKGPKTGRFAIFGARS